MAAAEYRLHLAERPGDVAIWVQLGHAEKEQGQVAAAEAAYRRASELAPADPDPLLHLGHLLKQAARHDEAMETFRSLYRLTPADEEVTAELKRLAIRRQRGRPTIARPGSAVLALEDFFEFFAQQSNFTGIQRVQAAVALASIDDPSFDAHCIVAGPDENGTPTFLRVDDAAMREIIACASADAVRPEVLRGLLAEARLTAVPITLGPDCVILLLGAFWTLGSEVGRYIPSLRRGARLAAFLHDVIPITHPDYFEVNLCNAFWRALAVLLHLSDFILTNSDHTQAEVRRIVTAHGGRQMPMVTVPLAHAMRTAGATAGTLPSALKAVRGRRYVAYVSTIEGRKNHLYVVKAWQRLIAEKVAVPDLVFVGRHGWHIEPLTDLLRETNNLGGRVHIVHGLSDTELDAVYAGALFTVFTSVAEGWGIPVGESLVRGTPVVASNVAAIPEVGGAFVDYVDIDDLDSGVAVLRRMIEDSGYRNGRRRDIRNSFVARDWAAFGSDLVAKVNAKVADLPPWQPIAPIPFDEAVAIRPGAMMGRATPLPGYFAAPLTLALAESFYEPELSGAWMRGNAGEIAFRAPGAEGKRIVLLLAVDAAGWAIDEALSVSAAGVPLSMRRQFRLRRGRNFVRLETDVGTDGVVVALLEYRGKAETPPGDSRCFAIGLNAIGWARADDRAMRSELREAMTFG